MSRLSLLLLLLGLSLATSTARAITVDEIVRLLDKGVGERVILEQVAAEDARLRLTSDEILALKEAGASDGLLRALIRTGRAPEVSDEARTSDAPERELEEDSLRAGGALVDRYAVPIPRARAYYDPFGWYWRPWPWYAGYHSPFRWIDCGFYHGGCWDHWWWRWGTWCDRRPPWRHGASDWRADSRIRDDGRGAWSRGSAAVRPRWQRHRDEPARPGWRRPPEGFDRGARGVERTPGRPGRSFSGSHGAGWRSPSGSSGARHGRGR
jgi:hypothetical protein